MHVDVLIQSIQTKIKQSISNIDITNARLPGAFSLRRLPTTKFCTIETIETDRIESITKNDNATDTDYRLPMLVFVSHSNRSAANCEMLLLTCLTTHPHSPKSK